MVSPAYAIELLNRALKEYTPSRAEASLANLLKDKSMDELGFEKTDIDNVGNVIATKGSGRPITLLCGHMDTVQLELRTVIYMVEGHQMQKAPSSQCY